MDSLITLVDLVGRRYGLGHGYQCQCAPCNRRRALVAIDNLNLKLAEKL